MEYYFLPVSGNVQKITEAEANEKMETISQQWDYESHLLGMFCLGVYDWAFTDHGNGRMSINIPNLRTGGSIPKNELASKLFGETLYGDCFLKPKEEKSDEIERLMK